MRTGTDGGLSTEGGGQHLGRLVPCQEHWVTWHEGGCQQH